MPFLSMLWRVRAGALSLGVLGLLAAPMASADGASMNVSSLVPRGPTRCLNMPVSTALLRPLSCWVTGPTSVVASGAAAGNDANGRVVVVHDQAVMVTELAGSRALRIKSVIGGQACFESPARKLIGLDLQSGRALPTCAPGAIALSSRRAGQAAVAASEVQLASPTPPAASSSLYVYGSYIDRCGPTDTVNCPLYQDGANAPIPSSGGLVVLDFGAPCFNPNTLAWGTQLFISQSCTPDSELVTLAGAWVRGYETNPSRSTYPLILALGTSNSLTAAVTGYALTQPQMTAHGGAWFQSVVLPVDGTVTNLPAPVQVWGADDIEESSSGDWYEAWRTRAWVDGFGQFSRQNKPCQAGSFGLMADYGDYIPNEPGWTIGDIAYVAWGAPAACAVPEIYVTPFATYWQNVNAWAQAHGLGTLPFTGVMSEDGVGGTLSAQDSWNALATAAGQSPPYLTVIGALQSASPVPPDVPTGVVAVPGAASATVNWSPPSWDGGRRIVGYTVIATAVAAAEQTVSVSGSPPPATVVVNGLTNGTTYTFTVSATNSAGLMSAPSSPSNAVTPSDAFPYTTVSTNQYQLTGSDGSTWQDVDPQNLSLTITPAVASTAIVNANGDLWTANAGYNQDIGISVDGTVAAWKESGGNNGAFSPNAAFVEASTGLSGGSSHVIKLVWKANRPDGGTIFAGAGASAPFSPTRLTVELVPESALPVTLRSAAIESQPILSGSDGTTWTPLGISLPTFTSASSGTALLSGNADLWTANAGYNQDLGIAVNGTVVAWKESGGYAGTFSPNAAFVQKAFPVTANSSYDVSLVWKTNKPQQANAQIRAGAGLGPLFSPTRLTLYFIPNGTGIFVASTTAQPRLSGSDGSSWTIVDDSSLSLGPQLTSNCMAIIGANADLWTANAGFNQDLAIAVLGVQRPLDGVAYPGGITGWKESGGVSATFSPNAAFVQTVIGLPSGGYTVVAEWKANRPDPGSIFSGAGPAAPFSPTSLIFRTFCG